jgi:HD-GYP domain-containing protein (c-di-GMP phosphodiesterase class II)
MNSGPGDIKQPEKIRLLHGLAVEMVIRLNVGLKSARIYEPNNLLFERQASLFMNLIKRSLSEFGRAHLTLRSNTLFFNSLRLKFGFANYHFFKFLIQEMKKLEVGGIDFGPETSEEELKLLMISLAKSTPKPGAVFETVNENGIARGIRHICLEKMLPADLASSAERYATKVFFLGITHLEEAFESENSEEKIKLSTTRRLIQSIFNHLVENESFVQGLTNIKNFHEYTLNHSLNVCILALALGRRLGLDRNELMDLGISAFFHDFGKLDTPKEILEKPSSLDDQERQIIEKHPYQGAGKLVQLREFKNLPLRAIHVALEHHVKEDLGGYPRYFKKQSANLFSKIVKIVDFFDAITTQRVYRTKSFTRSEALNLMLEKSGTEFHPVLLREFVKLMGVYPVGSLVALSSGEIGVVVENNPEISMLLRPRVKLIADAAGNKRDGEVIDLSGVDSSNVFLRTIIKTLNPDQYGVRVADYFLVQAQ